MYSGQMVVIDLALQRRGKKEREQGEGGINLYKKKYFSEEI